MRTPSSRTRPHLAARRPALVAACATTSPPPVAGRHPPVWIAIVCPPGSSLLKAVADAVERLDHVEIVVHLLELLAQPLDVAVDRPVIHVDLIVIGRVHEGIARLDDARSGGER